MNQPDDDLKMIEEMERLAREATKPPWRLLEGSSEDAAGVDAEDEQLGIEIWNSFDAAKDASLIAASRNNLPRLLALARIGVLAVKVIDEEVNRYLFESRASLSSINAFRDRLDAYKEQAK
jgi:hypothetical protein